MATRVASRDGTLRVEVGPAGVVVTIDGHPPDVSAVRPGHNWHWIVSGLDSSLHFSDGYAPFDSRHNQDARRPEDCPRCAKFLLESEGAGVHETEAARRNNNVSGAANCGRSGARGNRAACFPAPTSLEKKKR